MSLHFLNTSGAQRVAPFGGSDRRLSTNPICDRRAARGRRSGRPRHHDVDGRRRQADGRAEQGRARAGGLDRRQATARRRPIRRISTTAARCSPIGAHKGSGLSIVTDLLAGAVTTGTQLGSRRHDPAQQHAVDLHRAGRVRSRAATCSREARRFVDFVKASPPANAGEPVLAPGDVERRTRAARLRERRAARRQDVGGSARRGGARSGSTRSGRARSSPDGRGRA